MDLHSPTPPLAQGQAPTRRTHSRTYATQVRAFIEAAEVVDADADTIEDLLDGLDADAVFTDDTSEHEGGTPELDGDDELEALLQEVPKAWTKEEVKEMMTDLKEHGIHYFLNKYVVLKAIPIPRLLYAFGVCLCPELRSKRRKTLLYFLEVAMVRELQAREKLPMYNTVDDVINLIHKSRNIMVLTGAGISVSCGIPDFRSRNGLYAQLQERPEYELTDPQEMFDIQYFRENPAVFYSFASKIYPSNFIPSPCHRFIKLLEDKNKLLRNYTQNIDTLETQTGVRKVLQCHGSFATASCINCRVTVPGNAIETEIMNQTVPLCKVCSAIRPSVPVTKAKKKKRKNAAPWESDGEEEPDVPAWPPGIMKPDITFFGEKLSDAFERALVEDRPRVDLLLVIGTSLKVSPVSEILSHLPHSVPQILINKTPVRHINPDVVLLGNADEIVLHLCRRLGWDLPDPASSTTAGANTLDAERPNLRKRPSESFARTPQRVANSHVWLFEGADGGRWVEDLRREIEEQQAASPRADDSRSEDEGGEDDVMPQFKRPRTG